MDEDSPSTNHSTRNCEQEECEGGFDDWDWVEREVWRAAEAPKKMHEREKSGTKPWSSQQASCKHRGAVPGHARYRNPQSDAWPLVLADRMLRVVPRSVRPLCMKETTQIDLNFSPCKSYVTDEDQ